MFHSRVSLCITCVSGADADQKKVSFHLELKLWMAVCHLVSAGESNSVLHESNKCSTTDHLYCPEPLFLKTFEAEFHVNKTDLELTMWPRMTLRFQLFHCD